MKKLVKILSLSLVIVFAIAMMTACTPSSSEKMKERYEKNDYSVTTIISEKDKNEKIAWQITATPNSDSLLGAITSATKIVTATCYVNKEDAQAAYGSLANISEDNKFISGKIVVVGFSSESVKIAK